MAEKKKEFFEANKAEGKMADRDAQLELEYLEAEVKRRSLGVEGVEVFDIISSF